MVTAKNFRPSKAGKRSRLFDRPNDNCAQNSSNIPFSAGFVEAYLSSSSFSIGEVYPFNNYINYRVPGLRLFLSSIAQQKFAQDKTFNKSSWWLNTNPFEKYAHVKLERISPGIRGENKKYLKPPPSYHG